MSAAVLPDQTHRFQTDESGTCQNSALTSDSGKMAEVQEFLQCLSHHMLSRFPLVRRWDETSDICQHAALRLHKALQEVEIQDRRHLENLAAMQIRRTLIDLARRYARCVEMGQDRWTPNCLSKNVDEVFEQQADVEQFGEPEHLLRWAELHEQVALLPDEIREVFQLRFYREIKICEIAVILGLEMRTVQRRYRMARETLARFMTAEDVGTFM